MTPDERKWTAVLLFIVAFVLAIPALFGLVDTWLYAMRLPMVWTWSADYFMPLWVCMAGAGVVVMIAWVVWPSR